MPAIARIFFAAVLLGMLSINAHAAPYSLGFCNLTGETLIFDLGYSFETLLLPEENDCPYPLETDVHTTFKIKHPNGNGLAVCSARAFSRNDPKCVQLEGNLNVYGGNGIVYISKSGEEIFVDDAI